MFYQFLQLIKIDMDLDWKRKRQNDDSVLKFF